MDQEQVRDGDPVNHPTHYTQHPAGVECIEITEHTNFCLGNAIKYIWRVAFGKKEHEDPLQALQKARWYIDREITRRTVRCKVCGSSEPPVSDAGELR